MKYEQLVQGMLKQFGKATQKHVLEQTAKMSVLHKDTIGMRETIQERVDKAVVESADFELGQFHSATQALVRYRFGKYDAALESIAESNRRNQASGFKGEVWAMNRLVEAMCHSRRGDHDKAKVAFAKADFRLRERLADPDLMRESNFWHDWLICKLLHDECRTMLSKQRNEAGECRMRPC